MNEFKPYMEVCETLALSASAKGNSAVGSLLIFNGQIVAEAEEAASTKEDISCHAEMEVIRKARKLLGTDMSGSILVSTKEPCVMCSYAIRYHKISKVVFKEKASVLGGYHGASELLTTNMVSNEWGPPVECIEFKS